MRITFISLFPEFFNEFLKHSIVKRALEKKEVSFDFINPRDFSLKGRADDTVYGGGSGMLLMIEPIVKAIESVKEKNSYVILLGPRGKIYNQKKVKNLKKYKHIILISGHYEGIDARIYDYIDEEISVGEYILTGGEIPSMIIADSIIRLLPNVIKKESHQNESFEKKMMESDHFTKPLTFRGKSVPEVLLSGNHKEIEKWREENSKKNTKKYLKERKENDF
ncbi:MAG: tRNA (guanine-N(1)-)-methyltransferase [Candidatus Hepatoplasma vulgare]|nr:MAG: tRNA (guanine-N(1)-)-methyltransferase [Candidatus Hepatoplasma sp.]